MTKTKDHFFIYIAFVCLLLFVFTGCASKQTASKNKSPSTIRNNVILMHKDGEAHFLDETHVDPEDKFAHIFNSIDEFLEEEGNPECHLECNSKCLSTCDPDVDRRKNILVYFHGGLNSKEGAIKRVIENVEQIKACCQKHNVYPIFVNWRSGPFTTLGDHYFRIRNGEEAPSQAKWTSPLFIISDIAKTIGNIPIAWYTELRQLWENIENDAGDKYEAMIERDRDKDIVSMTPDSQDRNIGRHSQWVVTSPFKAISAPFLFTYGTPAWQNMKRRTHTMFASQKKDFRPPEEPPISTSGEPHLHPCGETQIFLRKLNNYILEKQSEGYPDLKLTLMGHSMGGIIINRALRNLPHISVDNIVYMASADNLQNFIDATFPLVKKNEDLQIYNLHLHPENEDREVSAKGFVPSGSLLVWIDHTFGNPEYILQRTSGRWTNIRQIINFIPDPYRKNYHFKIFGRNMSEKNTSGPQTHGAFDNPEFKFWHEKYWKGDTLN